MIPGHKQPESSSSLKPRRSVRSKISTYSSTVVYRRKGSSVFHSNYTLAYAYSDHPLGPWTYGGTIIDGRAREKDEQGNVIARQQPDGTTTGSTREINGQWYVFYHRQTGTNEYARQAMVAPISVKVEEGEGGKVEISEGECQQQWFCSPRSQSLRASFRRYRLLAYWSEASCSCMAR